MAKSLVKPVTDIKRGQEKRKRSSTWRRNILNGPELKLIVFIGLLVAVFCILYPEVFPTSSNLTNMSRVAGALIVVSIAQMLALLVGGFDLSVGANMGFASTVAALRMADGAPVPEAILVAVAAAGLIGLINGLLIAGVSISPFVVTLGTLTFLTGLANQLSGGYSVSGLPESFKNFGGADWGPIPSAIGIAAIVVFLSWLLLTRTRIGLYIYAIGGGRETSRISGVPVVRYEALAYTIGGLLAGLAGVMLASRVQIGQAALGSGFELQSIAAAVIGGVVIGGGIGRLSGVVLGVVVLTVLTTGMNIAGLSSFIQQMVTGVVVILAVIFARLDRGFWPFHFGLPGWLRPGHQKKE